MNDLIMRAYLGSDPHTYAAAFGLFRSSVGCHSTFGFVGKAAGEELANEETSRNEKRHWKT